jgi:hypothetical protein
MTHHHSNKGYISMYVLVFSAVSLIILSGLALWADTTVRAVFRDTDKAQAFMLAESGIEYYRWHLAHAQKDYQDGTGQAGPYIHQVTDKDGNTLGSFSLVITPPNVGSTLVTLQSTGSLVANPTQLKIIEARMAIPSFAKYSAVVGDFVRFGEGTEIFGSVHSNYGVRVDGVAHNLVTSSVAEDNDPDHSGGAEFGVHTHTAPVDPNPPAAVPSRPDVFMAGRQFPVAPIDFVGVTQDLANIKASAQADGFYRASSGQSNNGYHVVLKTDDTFDLYRVTALLKTPSGCTDVQGQQGWGTWTISTQTLLGNYAFPHNGLLFFEDDVWVDGMVNTARLTIAAARFPENPSKNAHIIINNDMRYTNYDGQDIVSFVAQGNITVGLQSEDDIRIDGALVAQNGRVGRHYYREPSGNQTRCGPYHIRNTITMYGMIASRERYGFAYTDGTGYTNRVIIYDPNLLYSPPPSFPLTADYYTPIFWNESQ